MHFTLESSTVIDAPPARVFDAITDIDRLPEWNTEIPRVVERSADVEAGSEWVVDIRALGSHWTSRSRAAEVAREQGRFAYRSQSDDGNPSHADWRWDVTPDGAGSCVRVRVEVTPLTFWRKALLSRMRKPTLQRAIDRSLRTLREQLETHDPATGHNQRETS
jgi:uncharacterized protein YndB with AHSA1/START domain